MTSLYTVRTLAAFYNVVTQQGAELDSVSTLDTTGTHLGTEDLNWFEQAAENSARSAFLLDPDPREVIDTAAYVGRTLASLGMPEVSADLCEAAVMRAILTALTGLGLRLGRAAISRRVHDALPLLGLVG